MIGRRKMAWLAGVGLCLFVGACVTIQNVGKVKKDNGLLFNHTFHVEEQGLDCTDCHAMETEEGDLVPMPLMPKHELCNMCHEIIGDAEDTSSCLFCHTRDDQLIDDRFRLVGAEQIFDHRPHVEGDLECTLCHDKPDERRLPKAPVMNWCMDCHATQRAELNECSVCHSVLREGERPSFRGETRIAHDSTQIWEHVHGQEANVDAAFCAKCHGAEDDCEACHRQNPPSDHTLSWRRRTHGLQAAWNRNKCSVCHEEESCRQCHENNKPSSHRARWGRPANAHCVSCHFPEQRTNCTVCHESIDHRTAFPSPHVIGIFPPNCALCHPGGIPTRPPHAQNSSVACIVCHN